MSGSRAARPRRIVASALLLAALLAPLSGRAEAGGAPGTWASRTYDLLVVRPVGVAGALVGAGFFAIAYPLTALFGDPEAARASFLEEPFRFAFRRPLGEFDDY